MTQQQQRPDRTYITRDEFHATVEPLVSAVNTLGQKVDGLNKRDNPTLIALGMLVLTIGALAASPFVRDIGRVESRVDTVEEQVYGMQSNRWTRTDHELFRDRQDDRFQQTREYTDNSRNLLDETLQREMRLLLDGPLERVKRLEEQMASAQERIADHQRDGHPTTVLREMQNVRDIAERARDRADDNAIDIAERVRVLEKDVAQVYSSGQDR